MVDKITSWKYTEDFISEPPAIIEARARAEELGIECITPASGAHLALLASALGAQAIVEAGTGAGVSALWMLSASNDSILATIDSQPEFQVAAKLAFRDAQIAPTRTRVISGKVIDVMANMADAAYDLAFLDADRTDLELQLRQASRLLRPGGVVVIAHALWRDRVPDPAMRDEATSVYRDILRFFAGQEDFISVLSPVGDGLLMASKRVTFS
ncbi:MAG: O-methyltransferase [Actinomycetota bacterium]